MTELNVLWHAKNDEVDFEQTMEDAKYKIKDRYYEKHNNKKKKREITLNVTLRKNNNKTPSS